MAEIGEKLVSDGLLTAGMPLLGYSLAFAYEAGYAGYYGIPLQLISVSLTQVLIAITATIFPLVFLLSISYVG